MNYGFTFVVCEFFFQQPHVSVGSMIRIKYLWLNSVNKILCLLYCHGVRLVYGQEQYVASVNLG